MANPNDILPNIFTDAWRFSPHTYAARVSGGKWKCWPHLRYIGNIIADAIFDGGGRIIINCPPRHGKSEFISKWTPLWVLDLDPTWRILLASYEATIAATWGQKSRDEVVNNPGRTNIHLRRDSKASENWQTDEGGGMTCAGVGGPLTGKGGDLLIIDDPYKNWQDAWSPLYRSRLVDWFQSTFYSRCEPKATIIVATTRWHQDDLVAFLTEKQGDKWTVINLPALAHAGDPLGRAEGDALCPERYPAEELRRIRIGSGPGSWNALWDGNPLPVGVGLAYEKFSIANVDSGLELRSDLPIQISFDFNINPGNHVEIGQYDPRVDEFTCIHEIHGPRLSIRSAMEAVCKLLAGREWQELYIFGDASGKSESAATAQSCYDLIIAYLVKANMRFRIKVPAANPAIKDRVDAFNEALCDIDGKRHYRIHPRCQRLLEDFKNQKTDSDGLPDESSIELGHAAAAEGYRVHYQRPLWKAIASKRPRQLTGRIITASRLA